MEGVFMDNRKIIEKINHLKKEKNAYIIAHIYQCPEIQDIADMVGDSLALSQHVRTVDQPLIVFCGVSFMAETAKIISPEKKILLPEINAGCPMADMADAEGVRKLKAQYPDAAVVCYVNSTAEVKAEADVCCTSSNAVKIVSSLKEKQIIFVPDQNLGNFVGEQLPDKEMILWEGFCPTHHQLTAANLSVVKDRYPNAKVLVHPECQKEIIDLADFAGSTAQIIRYAADSDANEFIIGTEMGVLHRLQNDSPNKKFYLLSSRLLCSNMKKITLDSVLHALESEVYDITLDEDLRLGALASLERMLTLS
jgi:quinolinate synthase